VKPRRRRSRPWKILRPPAKPPYFASLPGFADGRNATGGGQVENKRSLISYLLQGLLLRARRPTRARSVHSPILYETNFETVTVVDGADAPKLYSWTFDLVLPTSIWRIWTVMSSSAGCAAVVTMTSCQSSSFDRVRNREKSRGFAARANFYSVKPSHPLPLICQDRVQAGNR
jgi:hypothetical protein